MVNYDSLDVGAFITFGIQAGLAILFLVVVHLKSGIKPKPSEQPKTHYLIEPYVTIVVLLRTSLCLSLSRIGVALVFPSFAEPGPTIADETVGVSSSNLFGIFLGALALIVAILLVLSNLLLSTPFFFSVLDRTKKLLQNKEVTRICVLSGHGGKFAANVCKAFPASTMEVVDDYTNIHSVYSFYETRNNIIAEGVDPSRFSLNSATITSLPFPDNEFDLVFGFMSLRDVKESDQPAALGELMRVLKPGGLCMLTCFTLFSKKNPDKLKKAGFVQVNLQKEVRTFPPISMLYGFKPQNEQLPVTLEVTSKITINGSNGNGSSETVSLPILTRVSGQDNVSPPPAKKGTMLPFRIVLMILFIAIILAIDYGFFKAWNGANVPSYLNESQRINVNLLGSSIVFFGVSWLEVWIAMERFSTVTEGSLKEASAKGLAIFWIKQGVIGSIVISFVASSFFYFPSLAVAVIQYKYNLSSGVTNFLYFLFYFVPISLLIRVGKILASKRADAIKAKQAAAANNPPNVAVTTVVAM